MKHAWYISPEEQQRWLAELLHGRSWRRWNGKHCDATAGWRVLKTRSIPFPVQHIKYDHMHGKLELHEDHGADMSNLFQYNLEDIEQLYMGGTEGGVEDYQQMRFGSSQV